MGAQNQRDGLVNGVFLSLHQCLRGAAAEVGQGQLSPSTLSPFNLATLAHWERWERWLQQRAASVCLLVSSATFTDAIRLICHDFERE